MRAYVAGSTKDVANVRALQQLLRDAGWSITFDWTGVEGEIRSDWSGDAHVRGGDLSVREIAACATADAIFLLCPPRGLGCWVELGAALASGVPAIVVAPQRESVFFHHPLVTVVASMDEAMAAFPGAHTVTGSPETGGEK